MQRPPLIAIQFEACRLPECGQAQCRHAMCRREPRRKRPHGRDFSTATSGDGSKPCATSQRTCGTRSGPRRRRCGRRLAQTTECRPGEGGQCEYRRPAPQNLRCWDRCQRHRLHLDVGAGLISVDLEAHVAEAQSCALLMGDNDLDLLHAVDHRALTTDVTV